MIATEMAKGLGEGLVRRYANAFLLHGSGGAAHRAPAGHSVDAMFQLQEVRLHEGFDLLTEFRDSIAAGFVKGGATPRAALLKAGIVPARLLAAAPTPYV